MQYASKMDEFETFVSRAKYPSLNIIRAPDTLIDASVAAPSPASHSSRPKLLLIDDMPHVTDAESRRRLSAALRDLVLTARGPVRDTGYRLNPGG